MVNTLDYLKRFTKVVADTSDFKAISKYQPIDATTNPSLIYVASQMPIYENLIMESIQFAKSRATNFEDQLEETMDRINILFGCEILKLIPGRVSTEVDTKLAYDTEKCIEKSRKYVSMYKSLGFPEDRVLIKLPSTWEGIKAAEKLEMEGIHCNMTLIFNFEQAVACAEAGVTLISPFVGRIYDWHKKKFSIEHYGTGEDPGVKFVTRVYNYFKKNEYQTTIMGASFRNVQQIEDLTGIDLLTISPKLLEELQNKTTELSPLLSEPNAKSLQIPKIEINEQVFRTAMMEDVMAHEKFEEGILSFSQDTTKLEDFIKMKFHSSSLN